MKNTLVVSFVVSVAVAGVLVFVTRQEPTEVRIPQDRLGAVPGTEIEGNYFTVGGVQLAYVRQSLIATSSGATSCTFKNPFSTFALVRSFGVNFSTTSVVAQKVSVATSTNQYLSSTSSPAFVFENSVPADATAHVFAWQPGVGTSTLINKAHSADGRNQLKDGTTPFFIRSAEYIGLKTATSTPGKQELRGTCTAVFQKL